MTQNVVLSAVFGKGRDRRKIRAFFHVLSILDDIIRIEYQKMVMSMQKVKNEKEQGKKIKREENMSRPELKYVRVDKVFYGTKALAECMRSAIKVHSAK